MIRGHVALIGQSGTPRDRVRRALMQAAGVCTVHSFSTPIINVRVVARQRPDGVVIGSYDWEQPVFRTVADVARHLPESPILVHVLQHRPACSARYMRSGADAVAQTIDQVVVWVERTLGRDRQPVRRPARTVAPDRGVDNEPFDVLTDRELDVFFLFSRGATPERTARLLGMRPNTVRSHLRNIKDKLNLDSQPKLLRKAIEWTIAHDLQ